MKSLSFSVCVPVKQATGHLSDLCKVFIQELYKKSSRVAIFENERLMFNFCFIMIEFLSFDAKFLFHAPDVLPEMPTFTAITQGFCGS